MSRLFFHGGNTLQKSCSEAVLLFVSKIPFAPVSGVEVRMGGFVLEMTREFIVCSCQGANGWSESGPLGTHSSAWGLGSIFNSGVGARTVCGVSTIGGRGAEVPPSMARGLAVLARPQQPVLASCLVAWCRVGL